MSSHKLYDPQGIKALYKAHDAPSLPALITGGGQERMLRPLIRYVIGSVAKLTWFTRWKRFAFAKSKPQLTLLILIFQVHDIWCRLVPGLSPTAPLANLVYRIVCKSMSSPTPVVHTQALRINEATNV